MTHGPNMTSIEASQRPFAAYIDAIIRDTGWTVAELARKADVSPSTLTRPIANAKHAFEPSLRTLRKLAIAAPDVPVPPSFRLHSEESSVDAGTSSDKDGGSMHSLLRKGSGRKSGAAPLRLRVASDGRVEISESLVSLLDVNPGDALVARVEDGVLTIETVDNALRRVRASIRRYIPEGVSLVDELIADRRAEAARE